MFSKFSTIGIALSPRSRVRSDKGFKDNGDARNHYIAMHGLQEPELHDHEEPQETSGTHGDEEILQYVPETNAAQGSEVSIAVTLVLNSGE
jgi:hypothetical protein